MSTQKLPKRMPKWAQKKIKEERTVYIGTVDGLIEDLKELPSDAYAEIEEDYGDCYGHDELVVSWYRDHTAEEYHKERKQRTAENKKRREAQKVEEQKHIEKVRTEAIRLGIL